MNKKDSPSVFSNNLKRLRKRKGLSQYDLADSTGISQRMIAHYETHSALPSIDKIEIIADVLNVNTSELFKQNKLEDDQIDASQFDTRSLKKLQDILSLPHNDRVIIYRMLSKLLREQQQKHQSV